MLAATDVVGADGTADMVVTDLPGTSSLFAPVPEEGRFNARECRKVPATRLDDLAYFADGRTIDCHWLDVQGAEKVVLRGAEELLGRTRAVFSEVTTRYVAYEGGAGIDDVTALLAARGFRLQLLGTNPVNGEGNALWVRSAGDG
jgi:hypothetical protein